MKLMCNQCGKVIDLMESQSIALGDENQLKSFYFCSKEHLSQFAQRKGLKLSKD
jgi:hypothetical protein